MTTADTNIISVASTTLGDEKKQLLDMDMSESLFDYALLLSDVDTVNNNGNAMKDDALFDSLFHEDTEVSDNSSNSLSPPQRMNRPKVMQWGPHTGQETSTIVSIVLEHNEAMGPMKIVFGSITVETAQQQHTMGGNNSIWITLAASAPLFSETRSDSTEVFISICLFDQNDPDLAIDTWDVGKFTYSASDKDSTTKHRKRALSCNQSEQPQKKSTFDTKREGNDTVNSQLLKLLAPYDPLLNMNSMESNMMSPHSSAPWNKNQSNYSSTPIQQSAMLQRSLISRPNMYGMTPPQYKQEVPRNYVDTQQRQQKYIMQQQQQQHHLMSQAMNSYINNPMNNYGNGSYYYQKPNHALLYNISEQQRHILTRPPAPPQYNPDAPRRASAPASSYSITNSNSCALNKAHLKLNGDLIDMTIHWSMSEWQAGRRLVQFWRHTNNGADGNLSMVDCGFDPMDQQIYHQQRMRDNVAAVAAAAAAAVAVSNSPSVTNLNSANNRSTPIVVSCIYWREKNDYFITSVDCIYLLESLIGIQFTVEEKNRIRRNLEGFRPLTVSKSKLECAEFFKLIMSFPHPKPRNIEKDVKVFSWRALPHALRKIIRKYTPSYTTTAPLGPIHNRSMPNNPQDFTSNNLF